MPKDSPDRPDFVFGPALFFRGATDARWDLRVLVVDRSPPPELAIDGTPTAWQPLWTLDGLTAFAADLRLPRGQRSAYAIGPHRWSVAVPARDGDLRIACVSCNGEESEQPHDWRDERDAAWRHLADAHRAAPFHLLFQLGDQLYADPVWGCDPALRTWRRSGRRRRARAPFPETLRARVRAFYLQRYLETLSGPAPAELLARVPQVSIWDDHDIFDGWGSWRDSDQDSPTFDGLYAAARELFQVFQRAEAPDGTRTPLGLGLRVDDTLIVAPDLRSTRRRTQVMDAAAWTCLDAALDRARDARRLLLLSSVPFLNADLSLLERLLVLVPGQQLYQDDLRDQWTSFAHRAEWRRLHARLAELVAHGVEVTLLSGEIHLGAAGRARTPGGDYLQAISPGIAHRPPPPAFVRGLEWLARRPSQPGLPAGLEPLPGQGGRRYLAERGWLELTLGAGRPTRIAWRGPRVDGRGIVLSHGDPAGRTGAQTSSSVTTAK